MIRHSGLTGAEGLASKSCFDRSVSRSLFIMMPLFHVISHKGISQIESWTMVEIEYSTTGNVIKS